MKDKRFKPNPLKAAIYVRLTPQQLRTFKRKARKAEMPLTTWLRSLAEKEPA